MDNSSKSHQSPAAPNQDVSVSLEWQGVLDHSYDALDVLVHQFAAHGQPADTYTPTPPTIIGQFDGVLPISHYVL
ncbi:hypothetical protein [Burkholderia guangdongensis]|uniref:hypothetical protein n=1 Tax=Burkholderia guangdongensis TaxID=1792500 RepID=UPI0015C6BDB8|nr:hypothetical protein [Burkholderia guangdongensis]